MTIENGQKEQQQYTHERVLAEQTRERQARQQKPDLWEDFVLEPSSPPKHLPRNR